MTRSSFSLSTLVVWFDIVKVDKDDKLPGLAPAILVASALAYQMYTL
jgi:hypothetical protein